jgi:hypothetical protein
VVATALGFVDLAETAPDSVSDASVVAALWRDAGSRTDILVLARGHLEGLEQRGSDPSRAQALTYIQKALHSPPLLPR